MNNIDPSTIWTFVLAVASAVVLLSNAAEKIVKAVKAAKAPNLKQDERLTALENWRKTVDGKLDRDNDRLESIEDGNRASQRALLALLNHGIDGNNIKQMQDAKETLENYLINR
jgi:plasmid rolling circle replication initiator protein Rep